MPIYEYRCDSCGYELEALQKLSGEPLKNCPACDATGLRRLISAPSFRLKGDGWYETDFKSDKETKRNLVDSGESKGTKDDKESKPIDSGKDSKKSESKEKDAKSSGSSTKKGSSETVK
jgi:putative FmdB family regulatory protein